jgi:hypothetical protein
MRGPSHLVHARACVAYKTRNQHFKVVGSSSDEVTECFSMSLILPAALGPGADSASNTNEYQK